MILFGDLNAACLIGNKPQITVDVSQNRYLELDQIGFAACSVSIIVAHGLGEATRHAPHRGELMAAR